MQTSGSGSNKAASAETGNSAVIVSVSRDQSLMLAISLIEQKWYQTEVVYQEVEMEVVKLFKKSRSWLSWFLKFVNE